MSQIGLTSHILIGSATITRGSGCIRIDAPEGSVCLQRVFVHQQPGLTITAVRVDGVEFDPENMLRLPDGGLASPGVQLKGAVEIIVGADDNGIDVVGGAVVEVAHPEMLREFHSRVSDIQAEADRNETKDKPEVRDLYQMASRLGALNPLELGRTEAPMVETVCYVEVNSPMSAWIHEIELVSDASCVIRGIQVGGLPTHLGVGVQITPGVPRKVSLGRHPLPGGQAVRVSVTPKDPNAAPTCLSMTLRGDALNPYITQAAWESALMKALGDLANLA